MDITIYLPDEIGAKAKEAGLPLSQMLRAAVVAELDERNARAALAGKASPVTLFLENDHGSYKGRIVATRIADEGDITVYVTDSENVVIYDANRLSYTVSEDPAEELRDLLTEDAYVEAMSHLGLEAEIDLDV